MQKRPSQVYPEHNQYIDDTASDDLQSEDFSYQEMDLPPQVTRKFAAHQQPRPQTANQYSQERRMISSPPARFLSNAQHTIQQQHQQQQQQRPIQQTSFTQKLSHPGLHCHLTPQTKRQQQQQQVQRPVTAHSGRYVSASNVPIVETYSFSERIPKTVVSQQRKPFPQNSPRFVQSEATHQRIHFKANSNLQKRPIVKGNHTIVDKVSAPPLGYRFEETRSSEAARNIGLNFQTSQSSDLTFDKEKEMGYTNYNPYIPPGIGGPPSSGAHIEPAAKSISQIQTNPTDASVTGRMADLCGDGQQTSTQLPKDSNVIEQAVGLEKSKKMIVNLIDSAIQQLKTRDSKQSLLQKGDGVSVSVSTSTDESGSRQSTKRKKMECIGNLEAELTRLKILEEFNEYV